MTDLVRMRAVRAWLNTQHEGAVDPGQIIMAPPQRAKELERLELAVRMVDPASSRVIVHEDPAWGLTARPAQSKKSKRKR